jgi:hypothetical protein
VAPFGIKELEEETDPGAIRSLRVHRAAGGDEGGVNKITELRHLPGGHRMGPLAGFCTVVARNHKRCRIDSLKMVTS